MHILYIIGNGFDINLGMKTKYSDFYQYYKSIESNNEAINSLKSKINDDYDNWADLELALGDYTKNLNSITEFDSVFEDICENLADYVNVEETKLDYKKFKSEKLKEFLCSPEKCLQPADVNIVNQYKDQFRAGQYKVDIMTFNYTRTIEKIIGNEKLLGNQSNGHKITLHTINHIHGYHDNSMVMGVNDISQLSNDSFHKERDIIEAIVKIDCNKINKHTVDDNCQQLIQKADIICVFGSSIGDTDKYWWEQIGKELIKGKILIIYTKGREINPRASYKKGRIEREIKKRFFERAQLSSEDTQKVNDKVFIGVNTSMFDLK